VDSLTGGEAGLVRATARGVIVDEGKGERERREKRAREELGDGGDREERCGQLRVRWGGWRGEDGGRRRAKLGLVFAGADVYGGLGKLAALGVLSTPVPDYLRESEGGGGGTNRVRNGKSGKATWKWEGRRGGE
jgi:hypothetical protein